MSDCVCGQDPCVCVPVEQWTPCLQSALATSKSVCRADLQLAANEMAELREERDAARAALALYEVGELLSDGTETGHD